jgi:hypothetical protein
VHERKAWEYWSKKGKIVHAREINWETLDKATQWFITKHTVGMCGVGKFMRIWKESETCTCPRCGGEGEHEDARYFWQCKADSNRRLWIEQIDQLQRWCTAQGTDPWITQSITKGLSQWYHTSQDPSVDEDLEELYRLQSNIGWASFLEGSHHIQWQEKQQQYYIATSSTRTGRRWDIGLMKQLWNMLQRLWQDRNEHQHRTENQRTTQENKLCDLKLRHLYRRLDGVLGTEDGYLHNFAI